jgi:hypothetical protein
MPWPRARTASAVVRADARFCSDGSKAGWVLQIWTARSVTVRQRVRVPELADGRVDLWDEWSLELPSPCMTIRNADGSWSAWDQTPGDRRSRHQGGRTRRRIAVPGREKCSACRQRSPDTDGSACGWLRSETTPFASRSRSQLRTPCCRAGSPKAIHRTSTGLGLSKPASAIASSAAHGGGDQYEALPRRLAQ